MPELTCGQCPVAYTTPEDGLCCPLDDEGGGDNKYRTSEQTCEFPLADLQSAIPEHERRAYMLCCVVNARLARGEKP